VFGGTLRDLAPTANHTEPNESRSKQRQGAWLRHGGRNRLEVLRRDRGENQVAHHVEYGVELTPLGVPIVNGKAVLS
jgi:hypothetical protein